MILTQHSGGEEISALLGAVLPGSVAHGVKGSTANDSDLHSSVMLLLHVSSSLPSGLIINVFKSRDTNEATLASAVNGAATMEALMGEILEEHGAFDGAPPNRMPNAFVGHLADSSWGAPAAQVGKKVESRIAFDDAEQQACLTMRRLRRATASTPGALCADAVQPTA